MPTQSPHLPLLIDKQPELDALCEIVSGCNCIALDTEFVRTRTYAPHLGLVQIAAQGTAVCVDPLADLDYTTFWNLLFDPERTVLMHSATQDLEVMWFHSKRIVTSLIDTQVCAAFLDYPPQIGYAGLVAELAGDTLSKEQTRTDWTRRPLSDAQIDYAAKDVVYLDGMHNILRDRLNELGRYEWAVEDSRALCHTELYTPDPATAWQRVKSIPFLPGAEQSRAMALAAWREERAVNLDKPRRWVMEDKTLLSLASANPQDESDLVKLPDVPDGLARRQGSRLLKSLGAANDDYNDNPHRYVQQFPDREAEKAAMKKLGQIVRAKAAELKIPAEVLGSKRDITALMRGDPDARLSKGWRHELFDDSLTDALS